MKEKKSGQLRIAMLGHKRIPSREGGIEIVVEELSTRMVELGHAVTCYNRKGHHVSGVEFDGEERSEYKGVRLKTVPKDDLRILFTGFVQGKMLEELYSNAYVYVLPSDVEGMPLSLLEAMSYGNCCLVSDIKEITEVVEDKAVIFPKGNVNLLTKKLQFLCDNKSEVAQYKAQATEFICGKYNWNSVVNETVSLYY